MPEDMSTPVCVKVLKAKDVKQTDGQTFGFGAVGQLLVDDTVDFPNDPYEQLIVDSLRISKINQSDRITEYQAFRWIYDWIAICLNPWIPPFSTTTVSGSSGWTFLF